MCDIFVAPDGTRMIVCGGHHRSHRCACGKIAKLQCDWKVGKSTSGKPKTCDRWICEACALEVGADKHLCREHQEPYHAWVANREARAGE